MHNPLYDTMFAPHADRDTPFLYLPDGDVITHAAFVRRAAQLAHAAWDVTSRGADATNDLVTLIYTFIDRLDP